MTGTPCNAAGVLAGRLSVRACAQVVLAFLLFPVSRQTVTVLRNTPLRYIIPFGAALSLTRQLHTMTWS